MFGLVVFWGPHADTWDVRLPGEANWVVYPPAEYIYLAGYLTPLLVAWIPKNRQDLQGLAWDLIALTLLSTVCFVVLPIGSPARSFTPNTFSGRLLAWEISRPDFAAASFPSFHALWGILLAQACATRTRTVKVLGWTWALVMSVACVANGAHAIADVAASWVLYSVVTAERFKYFVRSLFRRYSSRGGYASAAHSPETKTGESA